LAIGPLRLSRLDSQNGSQTDCSLSGESEVQKTSPAELALKGRFFCFFAHGRPLFPKPNSKNRERTSPGRKRFIQMDCFRLSVIRAPSRESSIIGCERRFCVWRASSIIYMLSIPENRNYSSLAYSAFACCRMGTSRSASGGGRKRSAKRP
jgi:hypothetical protein